MALPRAQRFETAAARSRLKSRPKPYRVVTLERGSTLTYRRNKSPPNPWGIEVANRGKPWIRRLADADDHAPANGETILSYKQAIPAALALARGTDDSGAPLTIAVALDIYERDLVARGQSPSNASVVRHHLPDWLAGVPVATVTARQLSAWRDGHLADGMLPATLVRICKSFKAALNLSARRDPRIVNVHAWRTGLGGISESYASRNIQTLNDSQVRALIAAAYAIDHQFGLYLEVAATSGARISQVVRLTTADVPDNGGGPRLLMPSSRKGRNRRLGQYPVPISPALLARLKAAVGTRAATDSLLLRNDFKAWNPKSNDHAKFYQQAAERAGIAGTTMTCLRHSSITRQLLKNVPIRIVATSHDTSVAMIEATYSKHIVNHSDALVRAALLEPDEPAPNVAVRPLRRGR